MTKRCDGDPSFSHPPWIFVGDDWLVKEAVEWCRRNGVRAPFVVLSGQDFLSRPQQDLLNPGRTGVSSPMFDTPEKTTAWLKANDVMVTAVEVDRCLWKTRRLVLNNGSTMSYERLIIVQARTPMSLTHKEAALAGVISWFEGTPAWHRLNHCLPTAETFIIDGDTTASLQLALCLTQTWGKEVYWMMSGAEPFSAWAPGFVCRHLHHRLTGVTGLRLLHHQRIDHVLGEQQLQAVRTTANKIIAADVLISFRAKAKEATWIGALRRQQEQDGRDDGRGVVFVDVPVDPNAPFDWLQRTARRCIAAAFMDAMTGNVQTDPSTEDDFWCDRLVWDDRVWYFAGWGDEWHEAEDAVLIREQPSGLSVAVWRGERWCGWAGTDEVMFRLFEGYGRRRLGTEAMISWFRAWGHRVESSRWRPVAPLPGWRLLPAAAV